MVGGTGLEPVTPTVSWESYQVHGVNFESAGVSGSLILKPPFERQLRDLELIVLGPTPFPRELLIAHVKAIIHDGDLR